MLPVPRILSKTVSLTGIRRYHDRVVDHYENPRNVGSFNKDLTRGVDSSSSAVKIGTGLVGAPACGDVMKLHRPIHRTYFGCSLQDVRLRLGHRE